MSHTLLLLLILIFAYYPLQKLNYSLTGIQDIKFFFAVEF